MQPSEIKELPSARSLLYADGYSDTQLKKPIVAVVNSKNDIVPGHIHLDRLAAKVKQGISDAGGLPIEFQTIAICDGIAMGHAGMKYVLPSREIIADSIEVMIQAHGIFEAAVFIASCDKIVPGHLKAAARLDLPSIFVTGGPMEPGKYKGKEIDLKDVFAARAQYDKGRITKEEYDGVVCSACPGAGSCAGLFTANSMAVVTEALGLSLNGCATMGALNPAKEELAYASGKRVMSLMKEKITAKKIMTEKAFENALRVDMAIGASTNTLLHVPDLADEIGFNFDLKRINTLSDTTPNLVRISPSSKYFMSDFHRAGGVSAVFEQLWKAKLIHDTITVDDPISKRIDTASTKDEKVIRSLENPYSHNGGIAVLYGNLCPDGAVLKTAGVHPDFPPIFEGKARVFNSEEESIEFMNSPEFEKGQVIIIR
ncbi:MAG: dihydroxy-acid dehydratase, partial [Candidatus Ranarchaeia archaeon]